MIDIFYKSGGKILISKSEKDLAALENKNVLWIDLYAPSGEEKRACESFLGTELQSRAHAEEIESSSRYHETDTSIFVNTNFLVPGPEEYSMEAVSFILSGDTLTTLRDIPLRSFTVLQQKLVAIPTLFPTGYWVFMSILDQRVDLDADMIELLSKDIGIYSKRIEKQDHINEDFLLEINQLQENTMIVRENIVDKQRLITNLLKSTKYPKELEVRFNVLLQDILSLINHINFGFERLEYLQDTVMGLINLEQNKIMKIFTLVSLLLMPPTLVTGFYGMNVNLPILNNSWEWSIIIGIMLLSITIVLLIFKIKKLL